MSYLARLRTLDSGKHPPSALTKPTEAPFNFPKAPTLGTDKTDKRAFVGFVSDQDGRFQENEPPSEDVEAVAGSADDSQAHPPFVGFVSSQGGRFSENTQAHATGPAVECWTPAGGRLLVLARDEEHAAWLKRMNPKPAMNATPRPAPADVPERVKTMAEIIAFEANTTPEFCLGLLDGFDIAAINSGKAPELVDVWQAATRLALAREAEAAKA